ncbi:hypothetical protein [Pseudomonas syringae]|uniref:hypothetical protein n=1 Tax=Pseudomonas syringae TaxID=317 RepID=UPI001141DC46|nr:hypothetical protein [Pseudomonas syringae]
MPDSHKIEIPPGGTFRCPAGLYDQKTRLPRYEVDVQAFDVDASRQVVVDSEIMGRVDNYTWIWKIANKSTWPVFITLKKDGIPE